VYVINGKEWGEEKIYKCNGLIANWLIYEKNIPLFSQDKKFYYFARTKTLEEALKDLPFYYNIAKIFHEGGD
jgi:hypothetical protein